MRQTTYILGLVFAAGLTIIPLGAQEVLNLKIKDLTTHPLQTNGLSITITGLNGHQLFAAITRWAGRAHVKITIENKSSSFQAFSPFDLCFVGNDGIQVLPISTGHLVLGMEDLAGRPDRAGVLSRPGG